MTENIGYYITRSSTRCTAACSCSATLRAPRRAVAVPAPDLHLDDRDRRRVRGLARTPAALPLAVAAICLHAMWNGSASSAGRDRRRYLILLACSHPVAVIIATAAGSSPRSSITCPLRADRLSRADITMLSSLDRARPQLRCDRACPRVAMVTTSSRDGACAAARKPRVLAAGRSPSVSRPCRPVQPRTAFLAAAPPPPWPGPDRRDSPAVSSPRPDAAPVQPHGQR